MNLTINNKSGFIDSFLKPISRLSETSILTASGNEIASLCASLDNTTILYARYLLSNQNIDHVNINLPSVEKFINALKIIDDNDVDLIIETNNIQYKSDNLKFKFHLYEDGILAQPKLNVEKITNFKYDIELRVDSNIFDNLIKSSLIVPNINKVYFYSSEGKLYAELTDRVVDNSDMFTVCLSDSYDGPDFEPIPLMLGPLRSVSAFKTGDVNINFNTEHSIAQFCICNNTSILQYIIVGVVS